MKHMISLIYIFSTQYKSWFNHGINIYKYMQEKERIFFPVVIDAAKLKMHAWNLWNTLKYLGCPCGFASEELSWIMDVGVFVFGISVWSLVGSSASRPFIIIYLKLIL